jgi:hypothetical protein
MYVSLIGWVFQRLSFLVSAGFGQPEFGNICRHDLYVTIEEGDFQQDRKTSAKNIEVKAEVKRDVGDVVKVIPLEINLNIQDCIFWGSEDKPKSEFRTYVTYHQVSSKPIYQNFPEFSKME